MSVLRCYWRGWGAAARLWPALVLLYVIDAIFALVLAIPPAMHIGRTFGRSTMAPIIQGPMTLDWLLELSNGTEGAELPWLLFLLVPPIYLLVQTFLRGGVLGALAGGNRRFAWPEFYADCARLFPRLLLVLLFYIPGLILAGILGLLLNLLISALPAVGASGIVTNVVRAATIPALLLLLLMVLDYARISLALEPARSVWRHMGRATLFSLKRFLAVVLLGLSFTVAAAIIAGLYPALLQLSPAVEGMALGIFVQQLTVLLANWQRVATLAGQMKLFQC